MGCLCSLVQDREDTSSLTDLQIVQYHCDTDRVQAAQFQSMDAFTKKDKEMKEMSMASRKDSKNIHVSTTEDRNKIKTLAHAGLARAVKWNFFARCCLRLYSGNANKSTKQFSKWRLKIAF